MEAELNSARNDEGCDSETASKRETYSFVYVFKRTYVIPADEKQKMNVKCQTHSFSL